MSLRMLTRERRGWGERENRVERDRQRERERERMTGRGRTRETDRQQTDRWTERGRSCVKVEVVVLGSRP